MDNKTKEEIRKYLEKNRGALHINRLGNIVKDVYVMEGMATKQYGGNDYIRIFFDLRNEPIEIYCFEGDKQMGSGDMKDTGQRKITELMRIQEVAGFASKFGRKCEMRID